MEKPEGQPEAEIAVEEVAAEAAARGARVTLVSTVDLQVPDGATVRPVETAAQMQAALTEQRRQALLTLQASVEQQIGERRAKLDRGARFVGVGWRLAGCVGLGFRLQYDCLFGGRLGVAGAAGPVPTGSAWDWVCSGSCSLTFQISKLD